MLDIRFIRENTEVVKTSAKNKGVEVDIDKLLKLDEMRRGLITNVEAVRAERNEHAAKLKKGKPTEEQIEEGKEIKESLSTLEVQLGDLNEEFNSIYRLVPNVVSDDTPVGPDESANEVVKTVGEKPKFAFKPKPHWEIVEPRGLVNKEKAAEVSGARFAYMMGDLVELELALTNYIKDIVTSEAALKDIAKEAGLNVSTKPFTLVIPPEIIRTEIMEKMGRLDPPEDKYHIEGEDQILIGSAEHSLGPLHMGEVLDKTELPIRYLGISSAFRKEAGTYGKDTQGIIRVHQFRKLEFECFTDEKSGDDEQKLLVAIQEHIMQQLGLAYQVIAISTGDMGKPDYRQIDIEAWMPGQDKYRETHTSDNMRDFQARRLNIKYREEKAKLFVYMNDATASAGRTLIAIIENYQNEDGTITVPEVLRKYMNGKEQI